MTPADRAKMRETAQTKLKRGNNCEYCDGYGNINLMQADVVQARLNCEWCDGNQYADITMAEDIIALLDFVAAETARADRAERAMEMQAQAFVEAGQRWDDVLAAERGHAEELATALEPFAEVAGSWLSSFGDDTCVDEEGFRLGSLRQAARALAAYQVCKANREKTTDGQMSQLLKDLPAQEKR